MARQPVKSQIILDWIAVSYRSVVLTATAVLVIFVAGGLYWFHFAASGPRAEASEAIARAASRLAEAETHSGEGLLDEVRASAKVALGEARSLFDERKYDDARRAAIRSENLSQKAIDMARGSEAGSKQVRFYRLEGDVRVKRAGEFAWDAADRRMMLRVGDQVKTSSSASAQIIYFDGTVTTIQPGSLLEIRELYENPATKVRKVSEKLNWGALQASTPKRNVEGSFHEVATEKTSAKAVEPSEFRVAYDREKKTATFDVFSGRIEVASPARRESLAAGERIESTSEGKLSGKQTLPSIPRLIAPSDQRVFVYEEPARETTTLSWEAVPGAERYHLVISDKTLFTDPLYDDANRRETSILIDGIAAADYYWRVAAVSRAGIEGPFSPQRRFVVTSQKIRDRGDLTAPALEITEVVQMGPVVIMNGRTEPGALLWVDNEKIDVYDDGTFYAVVRLRKEGANDLILLAQDPAGNATKTIQRAYVETY